MAGNYYLLLFPISYSKFSIYPKFKAT